MKEEVRDWMIEADARFGKLSPLLKKWTLNFGLFLKWFFFNVFKKMTQLTIEPLHSACIHKI